MLNDFIPTISQGFIVWLWFVCVIGYGVWVYVWLRYYKLKIWMVSLKGCMGVDDRVGGMVIIRLHICKCWLSLIYVLLYTCTTSWTCDYIYLTVDVIEVDKVE